jgi:hypothetical protein
MSLHERVALAPRPESEPVVTVDDSLRVFHYSEDGTIRRFAPHVPPTNPSHRPAVWAIDEWHSPLYWFPRYCPRISVWATEPDQQERLTELFETEASRVCAAESEWLGRIRQGRLYRYEFDPATFEPWEGAEGQYVSYEAVRPRQVDTIDDMLALHTDAGVELRFTPKLGVLIDRILQSGLPFGFNRIRDLKR